MKINCYNKNGKRHGYWEFYHSNDQLLSVNGNEHGYWEEYLSNGATCLKQYYL